MTYQLFIYLR